MCIHMYVCVCVCVCMCVCVCVCVCEQSYAREQTFTRTSMKSFVKRVEHPVKDHRVRTDSNVF